MDLEVCLRILYSYDIYAVWITFKYILPYHETSWKLFPCLFSKSFTFHNWVFNSPGIFLIYVYSMRQGSNLIFKVNNQFSQHHFLNFLFLKFQICTPWMWIHQFLTFWHNCFMCYLTGFLQRTTFWSN